MKYSEYQDGLAALISHLGLVSNKSRTPHFIAMDTGIEKQRAEEILDGFPGIFRKSKNTSKSGEWFYTLQIRYALRQPQYKETTGDEAGTPLSVADVLSMLEFIARQAHQEQNMSLADSELRQIRELAQHDLEMSKRSMEGTLTVAQQQLDQNKTSARLSFAASLVAALASFVAIISAAMIRNGS